MAFVAALAALAPVGFASPPAYAAEKQPTVDYVALGDSYASGVGAGPESTGCRQTAGAYGKLWAATEADAVTLTFPACSGATTEDVAGKQLDALDAGTDLVTITAGANDLGLTDALRICVDANRADDCTAALEAIRTKLTTTLPANTAALVAKVEKAAPKAKVVVTGYPIPFKDVADCPALPIAKTLRDAGNSTFTALNSVLAGTAEQAGVAFADVAASFEGHALCDSAPWLVGLAGLGDDTILHPTAPGQRDGYLPALTGSAGTVGELQAWITARDAVPASPSASPSVSSPAPAGDPEASAGGGGGDEVTLPLTGANVWIIAGAGLVLLAGGAGAFTVARRRRIRTVA